MAMLLTLRRSRSTIFIFLIVLNGVVSDFLPSILWATYNPFFKNLKDTPRTVFLNDQFNLICANTKQYPVKTDAQINKDNIHANIYMVDQQGYEDCNATGSLKIQTCKDTLVLIAKTVKITDFVASIDIPKFEIGKVNYFIDTSDGTDATVNSQSGGRCSTHNMKMKIYVCTNPSDPKCPHGNQVINGGWSSWTECSDSGLQTRQCNYPTPTNGGLTCQGNSTKSCNHLDIPTQNPTTVNNNNTIIITPKKDKRTSETNTLGSLGVGAVVGIFLVIFILGCVLGILVGVFVAHNKLKYGHVIRRHKRPNVNPFDRNSVASTNNLRPVSILSNGTSSTGFTSYNDIYDEAKYKTIVE